MPELLFTSFLLLVTAELKPKTTSSHLPQPLNLKLPLLGFGTARAPLKPWTSDCLAWCLRICKGSHPESLVSDRETSTLSCPHSYFSPNFHPVNPLSFPSFEVSPGMVCVPSKVILPSQRLLGERYSRQFLPPQVKDKGEAVENGIGEVRGVECFKNISLCQP